MTSLHALSQQPEEPRPLPDEQGRFGEYGGAFVPETLVPVLSELERAYAEAKADNQFWSELWELMENYAGRETPLYEAKRLSRKLGGARIFLKREDLGHTGSHKINNALGQALLARRMGKNSLIAETGAGQHGVATATVAALMGMDCTVFMGELDVKRQALNVTRMQMLGAEVVPVLSGSRTLKDATNQAFRSWVSRAREAYYVIGSVVGAHPYPLMVRDFQSVIGREAKRQLLEASGRLPDAAVACVGGGSNSIGLFSAFLADSVDLIGVEAGGLGLESGKHAACLSAGKPGVLHGAYTYLLQDEYGQIMEAHSAAAGLDYPGVGPEHSFLKDLERVRYTAVTDLEAVDGFHLLTRCEGIIPALESSHAIAQAAKLAKEMSRGQIILVCLSGRGDKDVASIARLMEDLK